MTKNTPKKSNKGLVFKRLHTQDGVSPFDLFEYELRTSEIRNPAGDLVFQMKNVEVPKGWSQVATDILAQKYFRKAGVPQPDGSLGSENSVKQTVHRLAHCWRKWGQEYGYFASGSDADIFYDELVYSLLSQQAAPNSPQWFNTGLHSSYNIVGKPQGHYYVDPKTERITKSKNAYERPQPHACFILSVEDDLVNDGGIMDLWVREARIFKYGSGVGTNFSKIRGRNETLSGGGTSSGLMSFLKIGDRAAGAIKSGGTTRRAAKMVCLDLDHPEVMDFINWKKEEEKKVAALIKDGYSNHYEGEAYQTVSGQNSNNSVRIPARFFDKLNKGEDWELTARTDGRVMETIPSQKVWDAIAEAAWSCADPGVQFDDTINDWHTCPNGGRINGSNPCSEYMFLDNTACNLASLNLMKFFNTQDQSFDINGYEYAARIWTVVLEISVLMAQFPSKEVAQLSYEYRTLGLGYANLGTLLMVSGIPYDSPQATAICGALSSILTGNAYATSAEMAQSLGAFKAYEANKESMIRVIKNHRYAAYNTPMAYEGLSVPAVGIDPNYCPEDLLQAACNSWDKALKLGEQYGFRNAQTTVIAPTGTIGLLMDCDTTGIEPDFAMVKFKKLSGGGYFKIINQSIPLALHHLGYTKAQIQDIINHAKGHGTFNQCPHINHQTLVSKGFTPEDISKLEAGAQGAFEIGFLFNQFVLGEDCIQRLGFSPEDYTQPDFNLLKKLGFNAEQIKEANIFVCGTMTVEGAPHLKEEHLPIFDCANQCGATGTRYIHPHAHIRMMAAAQPFISGAISKTINLPNQASIDDIKSCYKLSWELGVKANALYRDGCKLSQPLSNKSDTEEEEDTKAENKAHQKEENVVDKAVGPHGSKNIQELTPEMVLDAARRIITESKDTQFKRQLSGIVERKKLPNKRRGFTQKAKIDGNTLFVRTGEYADGTVGEIFVDMHREGASFRSLMNCFSIAVSIGLQYGVPLEEYVDKFTFTRFEPAGMVEGHENIKSATSVVDYIFRLLGFEYLNREDLIHIKPGQQSANASKQSHKVEHPNPGEVSNTTKANESAPLIQSNPPKVTAGGDSPACKNCGNMTIRSGTCYTCLTCGSTTGCA